MVLFYQKMSIFHLHCWRTFSLCIELWLEFSFSTLLFYFLLASMDFHEKSVNIQLLFSYIWHMISLSLVKNFLFFQTAFSSLTIMSLAGIFLAFTLLGVEWTFWNCKFISFNDYQKVYKIIFFSNAFPVSFSLSWNKITWI